MSAPGQRPAASNHAHERPGREAARQPATTDQPLIQSDTHLTPPNRQVPTPDRHLAPQARPFTAVDQPLATPANSGDIAHTDPRSADAWDVGWGACQNLSENDTAGTCAAGTEATTHARAEAGASAACRAHVVQPGESLWDIASRELPPDASEHLVSSHVSRWFEANRTILTHPDRIYPGQTLTPPEGFS